MYRTAGPINVMYTHAICPNPFSGVLYAAHLCRRIPSGNIYPEISETDRPTDRTKRPRSHVRPIIPLLYIERMCVCACAERT